MPPPNPSRLRDPTAFAAPPCQDAAWSGRRHYASERALRVAALGRKNFLFVGHDEAGENLRVQAHPASRIAPRVLGELGGRLARRTVASSIIAGFTALRPVNRSSADSSRPIGREGGRHLLSRGDDTGSEPRPRHPTLTTGPAFRYG